MVTQQISPWTIYDQHGNIIISQQKPLQLQRPAIRKSIVPKKATKRQLIDRQIKINDLIEAISKQKSKLNEKINILTCLKIVRHYLFEETCPVNQIKIHLPKIGRPSEKLLYSQVKKVKPKHHFYSQKLGVLNGISQSALEDFSKIFVSVSLQPDPNNSAIAKPEFPKQKKNKSVLLTDLEIHKQFNDNSLIDVIESAKQSQFSKKISMSSLIYNNHR